MSTKSQAIPGLTLPASPLQEREEIRDAALSMIEGEQWLQSAGYRDSINKLASPKADEFLNGLREFQKNRARELDGAVHEAEASAANDLKRLRLLALFGALVGCALGILVGVAI